jgi:hypothetical protein
VAGAALTSALFVLKPHSREISHTEKPPEAAASNTAPGGAPAPALADVEARLDALKVENVRLTGKLAELTRKAAEKKSADEKPSFAKMFAAALGGGDGDTNSGGAFQDMIKAQMDMAVSGKLDAMKARLKLSPEQEASIRKLLEGSMTKGADLAGKMLSGKATPEELKDIGNPGSPEEAIKAILTPEQQAEYATMQTEERQNTARLMANQNLLQMQSTLGLTQDQQDKAFAVFYNQALDGASLPGGGNSLDFRGNLDRNMNALKDILSEDQLVRYRTLQEQQVKLMESILPKGINPAGANVQVKVVGAP